MATQYEKFISGLDSDKPDWFIVYANEQELKDFTRLVTDGHSGTVSAKISLRRWVSERLFGVIRAAYVGGVITLVTPDKTQVETEA
jgi:hypothetical protein